MFLIIWEMGGWDFASIPASATQPDEILGAEVDIAQNTPHHANLNGLSVSLPSGNGRPIYRQFGKPAIKGFQVAREEAREAPFDGRQA